MDDSSQKIDVRESAGGGFDASNGEARGQPLDTAGGSLYGQSAGKALPRGDTPPTITTGDTQAGNADWVPDST